MINESDVDYLRRGYDYNASTGVFVRKIRMGNAMPGTCAGGLSRGYVLISFRNKKRFAHHLAWLYVHGQWPRTTIDHVNRDASDNRIENLREVTVSQNMMNAKVRTDNTSGMKGVSWCKFTGRWVVVIHANKKRYSLGRFDSKDDAVAAYKKSSSELHGEYSIFSDEVF